MAVLRTLLASAVALAAGGAVLAGATDGFRAFTAETARRIAVREHPRAVPPAALQTADGRRIGFDALRGRWLIVDFIYTNCATVCSAQGGVFARLQRELAVPIAAGHVALMSISFDPARDDPAALAAYQRLHGGEGSGWIAARPADAAALAALLRSFGVVAVPDGGGGFVHNAALSVVDPDGRLVAILDWDDAAGAAGYVAQQMTP
ncbi:MAG: SCO family protein [Burkholderiaceae bacterium]|nr:SCO family protein [Burkholderiaceae bacterium]